MGNFIKEVEQVIVRVDKDCEAVDERCLLGLFQNDADFTENDTHFREDTLKLGFSNEAERVCKEVFDEVMADESIQTEGELLTTMVKKIIEETDNFIYNSSQYGDSKYTIIETEFEYIIVLSYIT